MNHHENTAPPTATTPPTPTTPTAPAQVFPEPTLVVRPWTDPVIDLVGHDPRSRYVEQFWLSVLGPSAVLLLRRLAFELSQTPEGFELDTVAWALELGLGTRGGKHSPFWRTLDRLCRFGLARRTGEIFEPRIMLPTLSLRQIKRLPAHLQVAHQEWYAAQDRPAA